MTQRGSAVVEFALVVPLVLALLLGLVEVALVARTQLEVVNAAREGAREAAASPDPSQAVRAARAALGEIGSSARVSVRRPDVVGRLAEVQVTLPYSVGAAFLGGVTVHITAKAVMRVER
ncbi:MAG: TadE family type IV pilus minor pilin [Actinomycetota bacterium]|nr:TadE family type IV pilus minor pilin [Actinomycetota bacterium]